MAFIFKFGSKDFKHEKFEEWIIKIVVDFMGFLLCQGCFTDNLKFDYFNALEAFITIEYS